MNSKKIQFLKFVFSSLTLILLSAGAHATPLSETEKSDLCQGVTTEFASVFPKGSKDASWEKPACLLNGTAKKLFSAEFTTDASLWKEAQNNYCSISPGWRLCFVCQVLKGTPEDIAIAEKCAQFSQPADQKLINTFKNQIKPTSNRAALTPRKQNAPSGSQ